MSEADKIIESLKNSGKKVEEFYVSNKTSDKNVVTEEDLEVLNEVLLHNRETEQVRIAIEHILAEREQDKQRIKELEEENTLQRRQLNSAFDNGYIHTDKIRKLIANETINISGFECIAVEDLQELLEGRNENG